MRQATTRPWWRLWPLFLAMHLVWLAACSNNSTVGAQVTATTVPGTSATEGGNQTPGNIPSPTTAKATPTATKAPFVPTATPVIDWTQLEQKPVHITALAAGAVCPATTSQYKVSPDYLYAAGQTPVYVVSQIPLARVAFTSPGPLDPGSTWHIAQIHWEIAASYHGPVLIRGKQMDGAHAVMFNGGLGQPASNPDGTEPLLPELRLYGTGQWTAVVTNVRLNAPGCYGLQMDGATFSNLVVIQAVFS